ncbi:MAG TPA: hypothetical protein VNO31_08350 [Umezawaea sp.]|nr:hypothetical protein [Umezawaea sp.]
MSSGAQPSNSQAIRATAASGSLKSTAAIAASSRGMNSTPAGVA